MEVKVSSDHIYLNSIIISNIDETVQQAIAIHCHFVGNGCRAKATNVLK